MTVVQRILRNHTVEVLTGQLLVQKREGRIVQTNLIRSEVKKLKLLCAEVHRVAQREPVFLGRFGRRVQLIVGGLQRFHNVPFQRLQHFVTAIRQVRVFGNDLS